MKKLILASASPRRKDILEKAGFKFVIMPSDKESADENVSPEKLAVKKAIEKARDVFSRTDGERVVLGADTVVYESGVILGKPADETEARKMLGRLSGKKHVVVTGYALFTENMSESGSVKSTVEFEELSDETVDSYIASGLWRGKAGAYGIQDGYPLVKKYEGDYDNIVGLPIGAIKESIEEFLK